MTADVNLVQSFASTVSQWLKMGRVVVSESVSRSIPSHTQNHIIYRQQSGSTAADDQPQITWKMVVNAMRVVVFFSV